MMGFQSQYFQLKNGWYTSFLKNVFIFHKICLKSKALKTFKISTDYHIKTCHLSNRGPFRKSLVPFFRRVCALFVGFKMKPLGKTVLKLKQKQAQILP